MSILKQNNNFCKDCYNSINNTTASITSEKVNSDKYELEIKSTNYNYVHGKKFKKQPTWIVVHYTACVNVNAKSMCKAMSKNTSASSHFYVDEDDIYAAVPLEYVAWHVGDGKCKQPSDKKLSLDELSKYKSTDWRYNLAAENHLQWKSDNDDFTGNSVSIGVDLCCKKKSNKTKSATDTDWYFEDETVENSAKLVAYLLNKYNISINHVIRHADATGKLCPQPFAWPIDVGDTNWNNFIEKVKSYINKIVLK